MDRKIQIDVSDELLAFLDDLASDQPKRQPTEIEQAVLAAIRRAAAEIQE